MRPRARLLATVLLLAPLAVACGRKEERPPVTTPPASPTPGSRAPEAPLLSTGVRPPATAAPKAPETTPPTPPTRPQAPPLPAATTSAPPPTPPPTTHEEKPAETPPAALPRPAAPRPKGKVTLPAKLGAVTFDHENHAGKQGIACTTCHHSNRPQKPLASAQQACRECHTMPAAPPMKTSLQAAFHDPRGATGTCIDCHKQKGGSAPAKCLDCHKKR